MEKFFNILLSLYILSNPVTIVWMTLLLLEINSYSEAQEKYNVSS